jgi:hypothetical protein
MALSYCLIVVLVHFIFMIAYDMLYLLVVRFLARSNKVVTRISLKLKVWDYVEV